MKNTTIKTFGILSILFTAILAIPFAPALAQSKDLGTPITSENVVDVLEIQRTISNLTNAADSARWDVVRNILEDEVDTTIGQTKPGVTAVMTSDKIAERWGGFFTTADKFVMHHIAANARIFFEDANNATAFSKGVIVLENTPAGEFADEGGTLRGSRWVTYEFGLTKKSDGWKVNRLLVSYHVQEWDSFKAQK